MIGVSDQQGTIEINDFEWAVINKLRALEIGQELHIFKRKEKARVKAVIQIRTTSSKLWIFHETLDKGLEEALE